MGHVMVEIQGDIFVSIEAEVDPVKGVNVSILPEGFTFTPENVNQSDVAGEGHAHIYVDGEMISRVYTPQFHLAGIAPGTHSVRVTLNANSHGPYAHHGQPIEASTEVTVPEALSPQHAEAGEIAASSPVSVSLHLEPDPAGGANLSLEPQGLTLAAPGVNGSHVPGEGYAQVYVNDVAIGRLYGSALHLGKLEPGLHEVRVRLKTNTHADYTWDGQVVEAIETVKLPEADTTGAAGHHGNSGSAGGDKPEPMAGGAAMAAEEPSSEAPVEGLEGSLQVEVTHAATNAARVLTLRGVSGDPGHYRADMIPTAAGVYEFRVFGIVEGTQIDESFVSKGGGGDFDDVESASVLQFPQELPEMRELESAVRGAMTTAEEAQEAAMGSASSSSSGSNTLSIVAIVLGAVGVVSGAGGLLVALRRR